MSQYRIEIYGYVEIEADSKEDAIQKVKDSFESEELTYEDLSFNVDYYEEDDE